MRFVPEIAGLRTVALLMVAAFHIWFGTVSGGVDIFLFVGAYLMTRSLTARAEAGRLTQPGTFVIRKFARLLPAAVTTIVLTMAAVLLLVEPRFWGTMFDQALSAATYTMNFWLQAEAVDYYAAQRFDASFFQHFWSLAIQAQIFVLWPLVHLATEGVARATRLPVRPLLVGVFSAIGLASFLYALYLTDFSQTFAYFDTLARAWEFAAGSLLALVAPWLSIPRLLRRGMTWLGVVGAALAGFVLPVELSFPGWAALWPVTCAALVVMAADAPRPAGIAPDRVLGSRVLQRVGGYTYALYLTHWPVLILYARLTGNAVPGLQHGFLVLGIAAAVAFVVTTVVERPIAAWMAGERPWSGPRLPRVGLRTVAALTTCTAVTLSASFGGNAWFTWDTERARGLVWNVDVSVRGPQAQPDQTFASLIPSDIVMGGSPVESPFTHCPPDEWDAGQCLETGPDDADHRLLVVGSSHAMAYTGMVWETNHRMETWHMRGYGAPGCVFPGLGAPPDNPCAETWTVALAYLEQFRPDMLIVLGSISEADGPDLLYDDSQSMREEFVLGDLRPLVEHAQSLGTQVVVVRDVPRFFDNPYDCGFDHGFSSPLCVWPTLPDPPALPGYIASLRERGAVWVDLTDAVCPGGLCRPTQGGLVTYYDQSHITDVYSRSLAQVFADQVHPHVPWWPANVWRP